MRLPRQVAVLPAASLRVADGDGLVVTGSGREPLQNIQYSMQNIHYFEVGR